MKKRIGLLVVLLGCHLLALDPPLPPLTPAERKASPAQAADLQREQKEKVEDLRQRRQQQRDSVAHMFRHLSEEEASRRREILRRQMELRGEPRPHKNNEMHRELRNWPIAKRDSLLQNRPTPSYEKTPPFIKDSLP
jgi:hypothetical protein